MGKKSGPPPPDYTGAAQQQAQSQQDLLSQQTWANRVNQSNPWGSTSWQATQVTDPTTGKPVTQWSQNTTLNPEQQAALDSQMQLQQGRSQLAAGMFGNLQQTYGQPMDWSQFTPMAQTPQGQATQSYNPFGYGLGNAGDVQKSLDYSGLQGVDDAATTRKRAEDAIYQSQASRLDPQWNQRQQDLETQLANRGITRNSAAFEREMQNFERGRADAYQQAQMGAITGGGAEAQRDYGMDLGLRQQQAAEQGQLGQFANQAQQQAFGQGLAGGQYGLQQQQQAFGQDIAANNQNFQQQMQMADYQNQMRQQQIAEALQQRGMGLNEINALLAGQEVGGPQFQGYAQAGQGQAADLLGAAQAQYGAAADRQSSRNASMGQTIGGIATIAATMF